EQGNQLDVASLDVGDTVYDADGKEYVLDYEDDDEPQYAEYEEQHDPVPVGKSASFPRAGTHTPSDDLLVDIQKSLANATPTVSGTIQLPRLLVRSVSSTSTLRSPRPLPPRSARCALSGSTPRSPSPTTSRLRTTCLVGC